MYYSLRWSVKAESFGILIWPQFAVKQHKVIPIKSAWYWTKMDQFFCVHKAIWWELKASASSPPTAAGRVFDIEHISH